MILKNKTYKFFFWLVAFATLLSMAGCDNKSTIEPRMDQTYIKIYGREFNDQAIDLLRLEEGGYVILGATAERAPAQEEEQAPRNIMLVFIDESGNEAEYYIREENDDLGRDELPVSMIRSGNDLYFTGTASRGSSSEMFLGKFSLTTRTFEWVNTFSNSGQDAANDLAMTVDGDILIGGRSGSFIYGFLINQDGSLNQKIIFNDSLESEVIRLITQPDNTYIFHNLFEGTQIIDDIEESEIAIGNKTYDQAYNDVRPNYSGIPGNDIPVDMVDLGRTNNPDFGRLIVLGYLSNRASNFVQTILVLEGTYDLTANGRITSWADPEEVVNTQGILPQSIIQTNDGGYAILGRDQLNYDDGGGVVLIKLNTRKEVEWVRKYGTGLITDTPGELIQDSDSRFIFNSTVSFNLEGTNTKIGLFKTDMMGNLDF